MQEISERMMAVTEPQCEEQKDQGVVHVLQKPRVISSYMPFHDPLLSRTLVLSLSTSVTLDKHYNRSTPPFLIQKRSIILVSSHEGECV